MEQEEHDQHLWSQFVKLGGMMGDGLHHEPDGKWIVKEYNKLAKILIPELKEQNKERRKLKAENINEQIQKLILEKKCGKCNGELRQSRSGSKIVYCVVCNSRFKAVSKK